MTDEQMSDRELLELAAKAAGIVGGLYCETSGDEPALYIPGASVGAPNSGFWCPLTDDGDALRLAVKLGIGVDHAATRSWAWRSWGSPTCLAQEEWHSGDANGATRRAIVRAAAAIGKAGS